MGKGKGKNFFRFGRHTYRPDVFNPDVKTLGFYRPLAFLVIVTIYLMTDGCDVVPQACVMADKTEVVPGEVVQFTNCSFEAHSYEWDFGDGTTSTEANPSKAWDTTGTFIVKLTAYSKRKKKTDEAVIPVKVGYRYIQKITLKTIPFQNQQGMPWDIGSGPDVAFIFGPAQTQNLPYMTPVITDLEPLDLPVEWSFSHMPIRMTGEPWNWRLVDKDVTSDDLILKWDLVNPMEYGYSPIYFQSLTGDTILMVYWQVQ